MASFIGIQIHRLNTTLAEAQAIADTLRNIKKYPITIKPKSIINKDLENNLDGLIIIAKVYTDNKEIIRDVGITILNEIRGDTRVKLSFSEKEFDINSFSTTIKSDPCRFYCSKYETFWGVIFHKDIFRDGDWTEQNLSILKEWLNQNFKERYSIIKEDKEYVNVILWSKEFLITSYPIIDGHNMGFTVKPYLIMSSSSQFPKQYEPPIWNYKAVPIKKTHWDLSGDDLSLDPKMW